MGLFYVHYSPLLLWDLFMYRVHFIMEPFMYNYSLCIKDSPHAPPTLHKKDPLIRLNWWHSYETILCTVHTWLQKSRLLAPPTLHWPCNKSWMIQYFMNNYLAVCLYLDCLIIGWCCRHLLILIERWIPCRTYFLLIICRYTDPCFINTLYYKL